MVQGQLFMYYVFIGLYLNIGLFDLFEVCKQVEVVYCNGYVFLNVVEGFICQIIGWCEYIWGIYFFEGFDYVSCNVLGQICDLFVVYWGGDMCMNCMVQVVG